MASSIKIVVAATISSAPQQAGWTWAVLQYLLGFRELGHHVSFVDPIRSTALSPGDVPLAKSPNASIFRQVMARFGLDDSSTLLLVDTRETVGASYDAVATAIREADVVLNISAVLRDSSLLELARLPVYVDVDPCFTQLWQKIQGVDMGFTGHRRFVTVGLRVGLSPEIPLLGKTWITSPPPVVLSHWPISEHTEYDALTTIANWRGYGSIDHNGKFFGQKAHALRPLITLPQRTRERFLLALAIHPDEERDVEALEANGWRLIDPATIAATPDQYQRFVRGSKAEFAIAKSGYVVSQSGWLSDRSVCYLASGRPVIAHDTGFGEFVPAGQGLFPFTTEDDVLAAIDALNSDYARHARAARALAEEYFSATRVLARLLDEVTA